MANKSQKANTKRRKRRKEEERQGLPKGALSSWDPGAAGPISDAKRAEAARIGRQVLQGAKAADSGSRAASRRSSAARAAEMDAAELFWAFLEASPELRSNDRSELKDTYQAWRSDPSNWQGAEPRGSPSAVLRCLAQKFKVIRIRDGNVVVYTGRQRSRAGEQAAVDLWAAPPSPSPLPQPRMRYATVLAEIDAGLHVVDTLEAAADAVNVLAGALTQLDDSDAAMAVDLEFYQQQGESKISLIQVAAPPSALFLFDVLSCPDVIRPIKILLQFPQIKKILHDCRHDEAHLQRQFEFGLENIFDTSAVDTVLRGVSEHSRRGLNDVYSSYTIASNTEKASIDHRAWGQRPLPDAMLSYAAQDVLYLVDAYFAMRVQLAALPPTAQQEAETRTRANLNLYRVNTGAEVDMVRAAHGRERSTNDRMVQDTADAFFAFLEQQPVAIVEGCGIRSTFKVVFDDWKANEQQRSGLEWRGGAEAVRVKLVRQSKLTVQREGIVQQPGQSASQAARAAAETVHLKREAIEADKGGISVHNTEPPEIATTLKSTAAPVDSVVSPGSTSAATYRIINSSRTPRRLRAVALVPGGGAFKLSAGRGICKPSARSTPSRATAEEVSLPVDLEAGEQLDVTIVCVPRTVGVVRAILSLQFDRFVCEPAGAAACAPEGKLERFSIGRFLEVRCGSAKLHAELKPTAPYTKKKRKRRRARNHALQPIPGVDLPIANSMPKWPNSLNAALPPKDWQQMMAIGEAEEWLAACPMAHGTEVDLAQYRLFFQRLLWLEEKQLEVDFRDFAMEAATFQQTERLYLALRVPGLAENRPSVLKGDRVNAWTLDGSGEKQGRAWCGVAHRVMRDEVLLRFDPRFHRSYLPGQHCDVEFVLSRSVWKLFLQGCELAPRLPTQVLFPQIVDAQTEQAPPARRGPEKLFGPGSGMPWRVPRNARLNNQQRQAVTEIVAAVCRPRPYLLFGPPGTGKTVTLVEAIYQIYVTQPDVKILACAPTNTAADLLVERLDTLDRRAMLRIMAFSRPVEAVDTSVLRFCLREEDNSGFRPPTLKEVQKYRIVVATLATAAKLHNLGVSRGHFQTIFVDEGGQALEPEAIAPVAPLLGAQDQLVIAGDPKQLGPIIHSHSAKACGLETSLLERLIARPVYAQDHQAWPNQGGYNPAVLTKLLKNYRAHPTLLTLPNLLFYDGELQAAAEETLTHCLCEWEHLPQSGVPLLFHGVEGKDEREANSPSWFNLSEIEQVLAYIKLLCVDTRLNKVAPRDIGVITPYAKQKRKLRTALETGEIVDGRMHHGFYREVKVGSTEEFQGQERKVIILSTVRSSKQFVEIDKKHNLGFLVNPKRFNVAFTRAQALVIVVGDPRVLLDDVNWGELLRYAVKLGAYIGSPLPAMDADPTDSKMDILRGQMDGLMHDEVVESSDDGSHSDEDEHEVAPSQRMQQESFPFERNE